MTITVKKIRTASKREWDRIWSGCDSATFFQSREWAEIWQEYTIGDFQPLPFMVKFSDGVRAILPFTLQESKQIHFSSPAGTYGGLISLDAVDDRHLAAVLEYVPKAIGRVFLRINPFAGGINKCVAALPFYDDETHVVYLKDGIENIFKGWTKGHKSAAVKARREGVTIRQSSSSKEWLEYFEMYKKSLDRWGDKASSKYGWPLFESLLNSRSANIKLWTAYHGEKAIAGAVCFYSKRHSVYWHGAALSEYFNLRPVQFLLYEVIRHAAENNFHWFDFNPSGGHEGVKLFKKGFGTTVLPCKWIEIEGQCNLEGWRNNLKRCRMRISKYLYEHNL